MRNYLDSLIFYTLSIAIVGMLGALSTIYTWESDWTRSGRNSLSETSVKVLERLEQPLRITSFVPDDPGLRRRVEAVLNRYRGQRPDLVELVVVNPFAEPDRVRELGITLSGELLLEYGDRQQTLKHISEESITNAIQSLAQPAYWIAGLNGHGERKLSGKANHDLGSFGTRLERKGFRLQSLSLAAFPSVPDNVNLLVIASPLVDLLEGELGLIQSYISRGGNLLWLTEPGKLGGLEPLATALGVRMLPGVVVDAGAGELGIDDPAVAVVPSYTEHPATRDFDLVSLYPRAAAFAVESAGGWRAHALLKTLSRSWNETGPLRGQIERNPDSGEIAGPLAVGLALTREHPLDGESGSRQQRILIVGDGDFLSNAYVNNAGNLDLGLRLVRWLVGETKLLEIPATTMPDLNFEITDNAKALIGLGFLFGLPGLLLGTGALIWWRRRRD